MPINVRNTFILPRFDRYLLALTVLVALFGAMYTVSWSDGSQLATVESLVDYHTWQIDQSVFTPHTGDKMFIDGHYYSDKPPVPALAMAALYQLFQWTTGLKTTQIPGLLAFLMALCFSGTAYVISVFCINQLSRQLNLPENIHAPLVASFAFGSIAMTYSRSCNVHILMLAVFAGLFLLLTKSTEPDSEKFTFKQLCLMGTLLGAGYSIDLGVGPVLVICTVFFLVCRTRSLAGAIIVLGASFPWFVLHHILNYRIGGTFLPANTVPQYFLFPDSTFNPQNLTGEGWAHQNLADFLTYSAGLLVGQQGFIVYNPMLFLAIPVGVAGCWDLKEKRSMVYFSISLIIGTVLLYAITSNNYSGRSCSIRWFVPLLVPFYYLLMLALKRFPAAVDLRIFAFWSIVLGCLLWHNQPWSLPMVPTLWYVNAAAIISWLIYRGFCFLFRPTATASDTKTEAAASSKIL